LVRGGFEVAFISSTYLMDPYEANFNTAIII